MFCKVQQDSKLKRIRLYKQHQNFSKLCSFVGNLCKITSLLIRHAAANQNHSPSCGLEKLIYITLSVDCLSHLTSKPLPPKQSVYWLNGLKIMTYYDFVFLIISAKDLTDNEELSFYEQCLTNLDVDLHASSSLPWASLADVGDTIAEFSLNVSTGVPERIYFFVLSN